MLTQACFRMFGLRDYLNSKLSTFKHKPDVSRPKENMQFLLESIKDPKKKKKKTQKGKTTFLAST